MNVLVLGAGVIGTTSAYFLAKQGHNVTVIDRQDNVAMETSHGNAGQLSYAFSSPWAAPGLPLDVIKWGLTGNSPLVINSNISLNTIKFMYRMYKNCNVNSYEINKSRMLRIANYSKQTLIDLENEISINYDQRKQGSLQLFWDQKEINKAKQDTLILDKFNIQYEFLDANGCVEAEPGLQYVKNKL
jgi:D-amino-acid dehydrogenase